MKVLIVDDEILVRESLSKSLKEFSSAEILEAEDGIQAFEIIQKSNPDIIFADIRMPGMDGLTLMSKVKGLMENTIFVFISSYDLFEYAQKAISLGAFAYLLKPIPTDELKDIFDKVNDFLLKKEKHQVEFSEMKIKMDDSLDFMRKHFIQELMKNKSFNVDYINKKIQQLNISLPGNKFFVIYISIDNYSLITANLSLNDEELLKYRIESITIQAIQSFRVNGYVFPLEDGIGILINLSDRDTSFFQQQLRSLCNKILDSISECERHTITIGVGRMADNITSVRDSFSDAKKAVTHRLVQGDNRIIFHTGFDEGSKTVNMISSKNEQELCMHFVNSNYTEALELIKKIYMPYGSCFTSDAGNVTRLHFQLIMLIFKVLSQIGIDPEKILGDEFVLYSEINTCSSFDSIIEWYQNILDRCFNEISRNNNDEINDSNLMRKAREFIHANFNKDVTLDIVAEHIHLSPSYFSKIFKKETGETFTDYLANYRISIAKSLLKDNMYKAVEVSEMVGFRDIKYFYKVFKKHTDLTPSEFKNL